MHRAGLDMSTAKLQAVTAALTVCVVAFAYLAASTLLDERTPTERGMIAALAPLAERTSDQIGAVVLGSSLSHSALLGHQELSTALSEAAGRKVVAANLSVDGAVIGTYERVLEDIWAADPDILVVEVDLFFLPEVRFPDRSFRTQLTRWFERTEPERYELRPCRERQEESDLARTARRIEDWSMQEERLRQMQAFLEVATTNIEMVVWLSPPRSKEVTESVMGHDLEIRADVLDAAADFGLVPPFEYEPLPLDDYCDFSHLRQEAAAHYLAQWALSLQPLLASS